VAVLPPLVGLFAGVLIASALLRAGVFQLEDAVGTLVHYVAGAVLAFALGLFGRWREGARPLGVTVVLTLLLTFALRRWVTQWINLEPFDWRSGPAGQSTGIVLPFEGLVLGVAVALDTVARRSRR
jgi:hypothetical protein